MRKLEGKVAIITGAARGQGAREAELFVEHGARVILTDISPDGEAVAAALGSDRAVFVRHDVGAPESWVEVVGTAVERFGGVDILVNNAGIFQRASIEETTDAVYDEIQRVNQRGVFLGIRAVIPAMRARGGGSIVNISSGAGLRGVPGMIAYATTKWAIRGMTHCAALELAPDRIRVNSVHPGVIDTPMITSNMPDAIARMALLSPLGRVGTTDDVGPAVLYLASDDASYVSGAELAVDGASTA
jgi:3alpha(or 20beta)-hydroxysteroid dehydrogenase